MSESEQLTGCHYCKNIVIV